MIPRQPESFEEAMSYLTAAIGQVERLDRLDAEQQDRLRRAVVRLANSERKHSRA